MEPKTSLPRLQIPVTCPYPELHTCVYLNQALIYPQTFEPSNGYPPGEHIYRHTLIIT